MNCLIALGETEHQHHRAVQRWLQNTGKSDWGVCPLTESGFVRVTTNPAYRPSVRTIEQATAILADFARAPGYRYWPMTGRWADLTLPFTDRIFGHQQVTDAYLLGLAIKQRGVLVTFDRGIQYLAGPKFARHVLVLTAAE